MRDYNTPNLKVEADAPGDKYQIVKFTGELDKLGLDSVKTQVELIVDDLKPEKIVFDFDRLEFINSESIGFMMTLYMRLTKKNKKLIVLNAKSHVKDVLHVIGLTKLIPCYDSAAEMEQAINA
jgi:stage II sporulation protein AA (anti-sigma F factor antagonist)